MNQIRYAIVDDEEPGRDNLRLAMAHHSRWRLQAECASAQAARAALAAQALDVLFLDIQMPRESGLALAGELGRMAEPPLVIFVTAHSAHALTAFEVHALDYLLKPLDDARLAQALDRAAALLAQRQRAAYAAALRDYAAQPARLERVNVRSVGRIEQVHMAEVLWIAAAGNYVALHTAGRELLHRVSLGRFEALLHPDEFLRVHRSAIVRRDQVAGLAVEGEETYTALLRCGARVPVSERYVGAVRAQLA